MSKVDSLISTLLIDPTHHAHYIAGDIKDAKVRLQKYVETYEGFYKIGIVLVPIPDREETLHHFCKCSYCNNVFDGVTACPHCGASVITINNPIAAWSVIDSGTLYIYEVDSVRDTVLVGLNKNVPSWYPISTNMDFRAGIYFGGEWYYFDECMRLSR